MKDVHDVGGSRPLTPQEIKQYQTDHEEGFQLFQKSFSEYVKPNLEYHKKEKFKEVMDNALKIMNQTASVALQAAKQKQESKLIDDYHTYIDNPNTENQKQVTQDIDSLK